MTEEDQRPDVHLRRDDTRGFIQIPRSIAYSTTMSAPAKLLFGMLVDIGFKTGTVWLGIPGICEVLGTGPDAARGYLRELEAAELLEVTRRGRGLTNTYTLNFELILGVHSAPKNTEKPRSRTRKNRAQNTEKPRSKQIEKEEIENTASPPAQQAPTAVDAAPGGTVVSAKDFIEAQRLRYRADGGNKIGIIGDIYTFMVGEKPIWPRLGATLKKGITFDEAVSAILETTQRNPTDDPMNYVIAVMERKHGITSTRRGAQNRRGRAAGSGATSGPDDEAFNRKWSRRLAAPDGDSAEAPRILDGYSRDGGAPGST